MTLRTAAAVLGALLSVLLSGAFLATTHHALASYAPPHFVLGAFNASSAGPAAAAALAVLKNLLFTKS
jgi:hypothetical protein